jgi:hypothetical protein
LGSFFLLQRFTTADARQMLLGGVPARTEGSGGDIPGQPAQDTPIEPAPWPHRSPLTLLALAVAAGAHLMLITSASAAAPGGPLAAAGANWISRAELVGEQEFEFIHRYLGPDSTFTRYRVPPKLGYSTAAVDVITAPSLEALRTIRYMVWYPTT